MKNVSSCKSSQCSPWSPSWFKKPRAATRMSATEHTFSEQKCLTHCSIGWAKQSHMLIPMSRVCLKLNMCQVDKTNNWAYDLPAYEATPCEVLRLMRRRPAKYYDEYLLCNLFQCKNSKRGYCVPLAGNSSDGRPVALKGAVPATRYNIPCSMGNL